MKSPSKPFLIEKRQVYEAYLKVRSKEGAGGVDKVTLEQFEKDLKSNLYKIWNRMSSGAYFPPSVRAVTIPKKSGGERVLGVPTVADRVAQTVVRQMIEPALDKIFLADSYGYRPGKSAHDALDVTRKRCWKFDWVLEFDIKGLFDNIDHSLLMRAVRKHVDCPWALLYIERWLVAPMLRENGKLLERTRGTPQGGVVSPVLANLFLHYTFDLWMARNFPHLRWCRYADDGLVHCRTEKEAWSVRAALNSRMAECRLELHPTKTKIVYCRDDRRKGKFENVAFDFLGYGFRPRSVKGPGSQNMFCGYTPAVSKAALNAMRSTVRSMRLRRRTQSTLDDIARELNPITRGWIAYYGRYTRSALYPLVRYIDQTLAVWIKRKYKRFHHRLGQARDFLAKIARENPRLFVHWQLGVGGRPT